MVHHFTIFAVKCSNLCNHLDEFYTQAREKQKNTPPPKKKKKKKQQKNKEQPLIFQEMEFSCPKKKPFQTF